jgi:hypothetical protein
MLGQTEFIDPTLAEYRSRFGVLVRSLGIGIGIGIGLAALVECRKVDCSCTGAQAPGCDLLYRMYDSERCAVSEAPLGV